MTDEELVERLLDWEEYDEGDINDAREAAANRIKELKAELAGGSFYQEKDIDALQDRLAAQAAEIERLRAKLTKAEAMLEREIMRAEQRGYASAMEAERKLHEAHIKAQAAEIERLNTQCEGLFQAAMNNGQALIIAEDKLAKVTAAYRLEATRRDDYSHAAFDQHITELTGGKT